MSNSHAVRYMIVGEYMKSMRTALFFILVFETLAQTPQAGRGQFENRCSVCHGADGTGGELGPNIVGRLTRLNDADLTALIRAGLPARGMPASNLNDPEMGSLITFLRTLRADRRVPARRTIGMTDGRSLEGLVLNESFLDLQLRTDDLQVHLLRAVGNKYREVTSQADWPTYNGDVRGNRYTTLDRIKKTNVAGLTAKWIFTPENVSRLETTPVVVQGIMYVTSGNECWLGARDLAFSALQNEGFGRQRGWRLQSRGGVGGQSRIHGD
jgi:alcohol dehydrogenase (cytochrome c)